MPASRSELPVKPRSGVKPMGPIIDISAMLLALLCCGPAFAANGGPVLAYSADEGDGAVLADSIGGHDATIADGQWAKSRLRAALRFNGAGTVATLEDSAAVPLADAFTVDVWYRAEGATDPVALVIKPSTFRLLLYPTDKKFLVEVRAAGGERIYSMPKAPVQFGVWQHVALTYAPEASATLFLDGEAIFTDGTELGTLAGATAAMRIGLGISVEHSRYYRGLIGGVRLWDRALAREDIEQIMRDEESTLEGTFRGPEDLTPTLPAPEPIDIGSRKQLFIDERFIESSKGVGLRMNPPRKLGPVLVPEMPWELNFGFCASVIEDGGKYKLFYRCESADEGANVCLATSEDGLTWERPVLGLVEYAGSKENNIVFHGVGEAVVFLDPHGKAEERYKMIVMQDWPDPEKGGLYCHTSPDGLHWTPGPHVLDIGPDTANQAAWDVQRGKYVAYVRKWDPQRKVGRIETDDILKPWPYTDLGDEAYFIWGRDKIPVPSHEMPTAFGYDEQDPVISDHYNPAAVEYPWAQAAYFMFPSAYMHHPAPPPNDGLLDIQLATSRDGVEFQRLVRSPYVALGRTGEIDSQCQYMAVGMLRAGDDIYQYYGGYSVSHGRHNEARAAKRCQGSFCAVRQRLDGFISADAEYAGGKLLTPPIRFEGTELVLNIDCSAMGACRVGIMDAEGETIPGFGVENCSIIYGNHIAKTVSWDGNSDVSALAGKSARLYFDMRAAKLYAFQFKATE